MNEEGIAAAGNEAVGCYWAHQSAEDVEVVPCFCVLCMLVQKGRGGFAVLIGAVS